MATVTITTFDIPDWHWNGATGKLRLYASKPWTDSDGIWHGQGSPGSKTGFYQEVAFTVASNTVTIPTFSTPSTQDALLAIDRSVTITGVLFDAAGTERAHLFDNWVIPASPTTTTWASLRTINSAKTLPQPVLHYLDTVGVQALIDSQVGSLNDASTSVKGRTKLSTAPASASNPIAVGDNDGRIPTQAENDALVGTAGSPSSSNKYVTANDARISHFINVKAPAYGATGDGSTDDTAAINLALTAFNSSGGTLFFPPGTYLVRKTTAGAIFTVTKTGRVMGSGMQSSVIKVSSDTHASCDVFKVATTDNGQESGMYFGHFKVESVNGTSARHCINFNQTAPRGLENILVEHLYLAPTGGRSIACINATADPNNCRDMRILFCELWGGFYAESLGDTVNIWANRFPTTNSLYTGSSNPAMEISCGSGTTTLNIIGNNITMKGGGLWLKDGGYQCNFIGNIAEMFLAGSTGHNGAVIDIDGSGSGENAAVYTFTAHGNMIGSVSGIELDGIRLNHCVNAYLPENTFNIPAGKSCVVIGSNAVSPFIGVVTNTGAGDGVDNSSTTTRAPVYAFYTMPSVGSGQTGHIRMLGNAVFDSTPTDPVTVRLNLQDQTDVAELLFGDADVTYGGLRFYGSTHGTTALRRDLELFASDSGASIHFSTNDTKRWELGSSGILAPMVDNTHDLGTTLLRPRTVYAGTSVVTPAITVGGGTSITKTVVYAPSLTPASVAANTSAEQDFTVSGLTTADKVMLNGPAPTAGTGIVNVRVKAADTLSITFGNFTAGSLTPASGTYSIVAVRS